MYEQGMNRLFLNTLQTTDYGHRDSRLLRVLSRGGNRILSALSGKTEPAPEISTSVRWKFALHPMAMEEQLTMQNHQPARRAA